MHTGYSAAEQLTAARLVVSSRLFVPSFFPTYLRLLLLVFADANDKNGNVMLIVLLKDVVGHGQDAQRPHVEAGFLERLATSTGKGVLAKIKMAAGKLPFS